MNDDYGHFGKGQTGHAHYMQTLEGNSKHEPAHTRHHRKPQKTLGIAGFIALLILSLLGYIIAFFR